MAKVYVAGATIPTGGAFMAYHIGRLLHRHFGYELVDVEIVEIKDTIFHYDTIMPRVTIAEMERSIIKDDLLIVNPSFSSYLFGLFLPGRKIMYAQDFRTFLLLDCHCDLYISVSALVSRYIKALYTIDTKIIPAFIEVPDITITPWDARPEGSALVYIKNPTREHQLLLTSLRRKFEKTAPHIDLSNVIEGRGLTHQEFTEKLASVQYLVNLSLAEGFGLVPLEAMSLGTMVTGVDGLGGSDYMRQGENSLTASIKNLRPLAGIVQQAFEDKALAQKCVQGGFTTAVAHSYEHFKKSWLKELSIFLEQEAANA